MGSHKKVVKHAWIDEETRDHLETLADVVIECAAQDEEERDPFESYVQHVKAQFHRDKEDFRRRFVDGFCILVSEAQKL